MTEPLPTPTRRSLLAAMAAAGAGLGCVGHALAWARSLSPKVLYEPPLKRKIGPPSDFPKGIRFLPDEKVFVVHDDAGYRALSAVCTHLGCTVEREGEGFHCPCHGSAFAGDGAYRGGPAPRGLPWHPLSRATDGSLVVDLGVETGKDTVLAADKPR